MWSQLDILRVIKHIDYWDCDQLNCENQNIFKAMKFFCLSDKYTIFLNIWIEETIVHKEKQIFVWYYIRSFTHCFYFLFRLSQHVRNLFFDLGSATIQNLKYRDVWVFVGQKGIKGFSPYEEVCFSSSIISLFHSCYNQTTFQNISNKLVSILPMT